MPGHIRSTAGGLILEDSLSSSDRVRLGDIRVPYDRFLPLAGGFSLVVAGGSLVLLAIPKGGVAASGLAFLPIFAVGYSRVVGLDHPTRVRIYNHLLVLPGDHFRSIVRSLRIGVGEGRHHLSMMLRSGLVREDKTNGRCRYYAAGQGPVTDRNELFAKHWKYRDIRVRVLFAVRSMGEARAAAVAKSLGVSRQLAAYHLANLEELGLVKRSGGVYRAT